MSEAINSVIHDARSIVRPYARRGRRELHRKNYAFRAWFQPLTASARILPDFLILGAQKSGTTSLHKYLSTHPTVVPPLHKEVHYFDANYPDLDWYRGHFPAVWQVALRKYLKGQKTVTGEASPYYIFYPHAPARVRQTLPDVKLIVLLRNPVDRAYSHYYHQVQRNRETLGFEEAIAVEADRMAGEVEKIDADESYMSFAHVCLSYLARGIYVDQIEKWFEFFPREQMLILDSSRLLHQTQDTYAQVLTFLELPPHQLQISRRMNEGTYMQMNAQTRARLVAYFRPHNQRLYDLLDTKFDWDR